MPDLAKLNHELSQELYKQSIFWRIGRKDKRVIGMVGRFLRIIHFGKTINQTLQGQLKDEVNRRN